jgi:hypothetical protein
VTAVITANKGDNMNTSITEQGTAQATATGDQPKANKKASVARQRAHVAPKKAKSAKKASAPKNAFPTAKGLLIGRREIPEAAAQHSLSHRHRRLAHSDP